MQRYGWHAVFAIAAALVVALGVSAAQPTDEEVILGIEKGWTAATKSKHKSFCEKNFVEDFTYINENGKLLKGRAAYIDTVTKMAPVAEVKDTGDSIRVIGSTGIANGRFVVKYAEGTSAETRYTDVYAKGAGGWKAVASHETTVGK